MTQCVKYSINDDSIDENDEDFFVTLSSPDVFVTLFSASVVIQDDGKSNGVVAYLDTYPTVRHDLPVSKITQRNTQITIIVHQLW